MQGRDFSAELFGTAPPASPAAGRDFSAELFGTPAPATATASAVDQIPTGGVTAPAARPQDQSVFRQVADVPLKLAGGVTTGIRQISDAFGADTALSKSLRGAEDWIAELYSAQSKQDSKRMAQIMKEAEDKGALDQVMAGVRAAQVAPVDLLVNALGTSAPQILAAVGAFVLGAPAAATSAAMLGTGAVMGAGTIKSAVYDATKEILAGQKELNLTPEQIEKIAVDAQAYGGKNLDSILLGSIIGAVGARTGAEPVIARTLAKQIAGKAAEKAATETALKTASREAAELAAKRGITKQAAITGGKEFGTEFIQGGQEQLAKNIAQQREGFDVPTMRGVVGQGTLEGLAGFGMGAIAGGRDAYTGKREFFRDQPVTGIPDEDLKKTVFTTAGENKQFKPPAPGSDDLNLLVPATDAAGKPLVGAAPETTAGKTRADADAEAAKLRLDEAATKATEYIAKVDAGEKPNRNVVNELGRNLGVKFPQAVKSNVAKLNLIREHLAAQGAPSVSTTGPLDQTGGAGAGMAGKPGAIDTAGGTTAAKPGGVDVAGAATTTTAAGKGAKPGAVTPTAPAAPKTKQEIQQEILKAATDEELQRAMVQIGGSEVSLLSPDLIQAEINKRGAAKSATKSAAQTDEDLLNDLLGGDSSLSARRTGAEMSRDEQLDKLGRRYGLSRSADESAQQFGARIKEAIAFEKMREGRPMSDIPATDLAGQTLREETSYVPPDLQIEAYEAERQKFNQTIEDESEQLPAYDKLTNDERRVYFQEGIARPGAGTAQEHARAARRLSDYRLGKREETIEGETKGREDYNRERDSFGRKTGLSYSFPAWNSLSDESKRLFTAINKTNSAIEQYSAFQAVKAQIQKEKTDEASREALAQAETDATRQMLDAAERARKSQPAGKGDILPDNIIEALAKGDIKTVLNYISEKGNGLKLKKTRINVFPFGVRKVNIRDSIAMGVFRSLAGTLSNIEGLKVNVVYDENMVYDQIARYDANTNTLYVGPNGLDEATILHELVHAATVKIIHQFYTDPSVLTERARKAVEQLIRIAAVAKSRLGSKYPNAFENLYEFVAYSQTDMNFQYDLAQQQVGRLAGATAKTEEQSRDIQTQRESKRGATMYDSLTDNLWNAYTGTLAYLYKLFTPGAKNTRILTLVPTQTGEDIKNKVQNPGKGLTGEAREKAIAAFNKKLREEKERDLQRKGEQKKAFEAKVKKELEAAEKEDAGLTEAEKFDRAIERLNKKRQLTAQEKAAFDIETLFDKEGQEYEAKIPDVDTAEYVPYEQGITGLKREILREPGYKGNLLLEAAEMFQLILAAPEGGITQLAGKEGIGAELYAKIPRLPAPPPLFKKSKKGAAAAPAPAPAPAAQPTEEEEKETRAGGVNNTQTREFYKPSAKEKIESTPGKIWRSLTTAAGWRETVRRFQDKSIQSRSLHRKLDLSGLINRDMDGAFNNFDEQRDLATGEARNFVNQYLRVPMDNIKQSISDYVKMTGQKLDDVLIDLHMFSEMFHEPERRNVKWVTSVPLSTTENLMHNGKKISAAQRRIDILGDPRTGKPGIKDRVELTEAQQRQLWDELTSLANNHADPAGDSIRPGIKDINKDSSDYNALGINQDEVNLRMQEYQALPDEQRQLLDKIFAEAREITKITAELNKIGNYWSFPVSNLVGMYNYQHYLPFKGVSKHSVADEFTSFDNKATGKELQEIVHAADGRFSTSDNPFLQMMSDAFRSAGRAGRRNYMQSIKNSVEPNKLNPTGTGVINGRVVKHIEFAERNTVDLTEFKGGSNIFVYNPDGSIDIVQIKDPKILEALRYSFRDASPTLDMLNSVTGFFGAMHTRYNYNFAPLNFVRDSLTNAWTMGAELGPMKSAQYIKTISAMVVKNGLGKAMEVAILHEKGDPVSQRMLADLARKDPFVRDMVEYLRRGGKTTYLESFSLKSSLHDLNTGLGKRRIIDTVEKFNKFVDVWNDMFEFTSRTAAFALRKEELVKKNIAKGMTEEAANRAAGTEAAAWTKNLANFEKAGEYARGMGAAYMFIRASATGAVRAAEATLPAFRPLSMAVNDLPAVIRDDPKALEEFKANYAKQRQNAQIMIGALMSAGFALFYMSSMMAPDDEWKRNTVKNDNMGQWTRFVRFHIPNEVSEKAGIGRDVVFQIPWGFGLGAFAAIGAQFAGFAAGASSAKEMLGNVFTSFADSFLPLPLSKIPLTESPESAGKWVVDTLAPTALRPLFEFAMNTNGIGQAINSAATRRMGDAFTGGDRIPEAYKDAAERMFEKSLGSIDVSPNTLYFFANSYLDGLAKVGEVLYSWVNLDRGEKTFNIKTDVPLIGSFFGAKTNVDSREYGEIEKQILKIDKRMNTLDQRDPARLAEYEAKNPLHGMLVDAYRSRQGELNRLRAEAREIRTMPGLSPKTRDELLRISTMQQNVLKYQMVQDFKALGMER
jgi:hypothetical protein